MGWEGHGQTIAPDLHLLALSRQLRPATSRKLQRDRWLLVNGLYDVLAVPYAEDVPRSWHLGLALRNVGGHSARTGCALQHLQTLELHPDGFAHIPHSNVLQRARIQYQGVALPKPQHREAPRRRQSHLHSAVLRKHIEGSGPPWHILAGRNRRHHISLVAQAHLAHQSPLHRGREVKENFDVRSRRYVRCTLEGPRCQKVWKALHSFVGRWNSRHAGTGVIARGDHPAQRGKGSSTGSCNLVPQSIAEKPRRQGDHVFHVRCVALSRRKLEDYLLAH
mmetsp:Transcript_44671/g.106285  ORF Transcript_44671/g.106285 Transcript_44671/m.106285 type:complete len:278 (+) Transcript_44671:2611-3444(+)